MDTASTSDLTLRQLQIFWTVAHAGSLTQAAKQLGMRQPSISQQLSKMEHLLGGKLIRFVGNEMRLTPGGEFLLGEAEQILASVERTKAGLAEFFAGRRGRFVIGALPSLARNLLLPALHRLLGSGGGQFIDVVETAPRDAIQQLHGRTMDMALISGYAAATRLSPGLRAIVLGEDAQLLAVPESLPDLSTVSHPERQLSEGDLVVLNRTIRYAFGSEHSDRTDMWYQQLLPDSTIVARCRSYESAMAFVEEGTGVALVPDLALRQQDRQLFRATLYKVPVARRQTVALLPQHYSSLPAFRILLGILGDVFDGITPLEARDTPPFASERLSAVAELAAAAPPPR